MYSLSGIVNNDIYFCLNNFYSISSYINDNIHNTNNYFYNSIYTISSNTYFKYATQNYCIQNYIPINSDINLQNNFNTTAISNPTIINGISHGPGDGATYNTFNLGIASIMVWYWLYR